MTTIANIVAVLCIATTGIATMLSLIYIHARKRRLLDDVVAHTRTLARTYALRAETSHVVELVHAMEAWGREEDGIPEDGPIGKAYDSARAWLRLIGAAEAQPEEAVCLRRAEEEE